MSKSVMGNLGEGLESLLEEAHRLTNHDRRDAYGHPLDNFQNHADILRVLVSARYGIDIAFTADFFGLVMQVAVKGAREAFKPSRENRVDAIGYANCQEMCFAEIERRSALANQDQVEE